MQDQQLVLSPFTQIKHLEDTAKAKVWNLINGKVFEVGAAIIEILLFLKQPRSYRELKEKFVCYDEQLYQVLNFLQQKSLISENEKQEDQLIAVRPVQNKLFNLETFDPTDKKFRIPFVGVPFGRGNPKSIESAKFPIHLRDLTHQFCLNLSRAGSRPFNFECLDAKINFTPLKALIEQKILKDYGDIVVDMNESSDFVYNKIYTIARRLFGHQRKPFFIGGDHSISYPIIKAAAEEYQNLHVIHFDAHTDTYTSPYSQLDHQGKIHHHGNFVSKCFENTSISHIYQFGIRGVSNIFQEEGEKQSIYWCSGLKHLLAEGGSLDLPSGVPYYVTFDIDVLDPGIAPATATPVPGGFSLEEIKVLFDRVLTGKNIVGMAPGRNKPWLR